MNSGDTKTEAMLNVLGNGGSGDQFRGCCNTKTQSYILDAIDRINNLDPGGGGSDFKKLTDADKNYTLDGEDYIAVWLLEPGRYILADDATVPILTSLIEEDDGQGGTIDTPGATFTSSEQPLLFLSVDEFGNCEATIDNTIGAYYFAIDEYHHVAAEQEFPVPQFGGTDGEYPGGDGLVPGPSTSDAGKFLCANGRWESAGGGTPVQTTGTSTTDVMSQDATTKMIFPDIANSPYKQVIGEGSIEGTNKGLAINGVLYSSITNGSIAIGAPDGNSAQIGQNGRADTSLAIGSGASAGRGNRSIAVGANSYTNSGQNNGDNVAIGYNTYAGNGTATNTVALGAYAKTTRTGEVNVGTGSNGSGYNSTNYRVIGGVHDPVDAHDAATKGYVDNLAGGTILYVKPTEYDVFSSTTQSGIHFYKEDTFTTTYTAEDIRSTLYGGGNMRIVVPDSSDPDNTYKHIMVFAGGTVLDQNSLGINGMTVYFNYNANGDKVSLYLEDPTDTTFSLSV